MSDRINEQVKQNAASIQAIIDNAKDLNELATITGNPVSADLFLIRIASTGQSVSITYAELLSLFNSGVASSFLDLTDTPANYNLKQGQNVKVSTSGNSLEFTPDNLTIMGTLATIDAGELTTYASATQPVNYVNSSFNIGDILSVHVTQIGSTNPGSGLKGTITYNIPFAI